MGVNETILIADKMDWPAVRKLERRYPGMVFYETIDAGGQPQIKTLKGEELTAAIKTHNPYTVYMRSEVVSEAAAQAARADIVWVRAGSGHDNFAEAKKAGHRIETTPGQNSSGVVDLEAGFLGLAFLDARLNSDEQHPALDVFRGVLEGRSIRESVAAYRAGPEEKGPKGEGQETITDDTITTLSKNRLPEFAGKKMVIFGVTGETGARMAKLAQALGMQILAVEGLERREVPKGIRVLSKEDALKEANVVSLNIPLVPTGKDRPTQGILGQNEFDLLSSRRVVVLNGARGGLIADNLMVPEGIIVYIDDDRKNMPKGMQIDPSNFYAMHQKSGAKTVQSFEQASKAAAERMSRAMDGLEPDSYGLVQPSSTAVIGMERQLTGVEERTAAGEKQ